MAKKAKMKEDETKKVVAKCDHLMVYSQLEVANCDIKEWTRTTFEPRDKTK